MDILDFGIHSSDMVYLILKFDLVFFIFFPIESRMYTNNFVCQEVEILNAKHFYSKFSQNVRCSWQLCRAHNIQFSFISWLDMPHLAWYRVPTNIPNWLLSYEQNSFGCFLKKFTFWIFPKTLKTVLLISQQPNIAQRPFCIQNERQDIFYHLI